MMHPKAPRVSVALGLSLALVACKSESTAPTAKAKAEAPAVAQRAQAIDKTAAPRHTVFAASAHINVVDAAAGTVAGRVHLQKSVRTIVFSRDGGTAFVGASDGVRAVDRATYEVRAQWTKRPVRYLELSTDGARLFVLEHQVDVKPDGSRVAHPFQLVTLDAKDGKELAREEVGERQVYARLAPSPEGRTVRVGEDGRIFVGAAGGKWGEGERLDPREGLADDAQVRVRNTVATHRDHVYVPVEGQPMARVLDIDTTNGQHRFIDLGGPASIRGLGVTPDGAKLLVNTGLSLMALDLSTGRPLAEPIAFSSAHMGCAISDDGRRAYFAKVIDGKGGAVTAVDLESFAIDSKVNLPEITPYTIAVAPTRR